jgi:hypothetical protein
MLPGFTHAAGPRRGLKRPPKGDIDDLLSPVRKPVGKLDPAGLARSAARVQLDP